MKYEAVISIVVAVLGVILFTVLLAYNLIGPIPYTYLISLLGFICIVLPVLSRLRELDMKNLKMTLDKIERTKQEIFAKEEDLAKVSLITSQLIAFNSAFEGRAHGGESYCLQNDWYHKKIKELLEAIKAPPEKREDVLKYFHVLRKQDAASKEEQQLVWDDLMNMIRKDISEN